MNEDRQLLGPLSVSILKQSACSVPRKTKEQRLDEAWDDLGNTLREQQHHGRAVARTMNALVGGLRQPVRRMRSMHGAASEKIRVVDTEGKTTTKIVEVLETLRKGAFLQDLDVALSDLVQAVREAKKSGKINAILTVAPAVKGASSDMMMIADDIKVTKPSKERGSTPFYATKHNTLQRENPRQAKFQGDGFDE